MSSSESDAALAAEPEGGAQAGGGPQPQAAQSPIVQAASQAVIGLFDQLGSQWAQLIPVQPPPGDPLGPFTDKILKGLAAQLRQALGGGPETPP
jgi:hypothetical protein